MAGEVGRGEGETWTHYFVTVWQCVVAGTSPAAGRGEEQRQEEEIVWIGKSRGEGMLRRDSSLLACIRFLSLYSSCCGYSHSWGWYTAPRPGTAAQGRLQLEGLKPFEQPYMGQALRGSWGGTWDGTHTGTAEVPSPWSRFPCLYSIFLLMGKKSPGLEML